MDSKNLSHSPEIETTARRRFLQLGAFCLSASSLARPTWAQPAVAASPGAFMALQDKRPLRIGMVIFPQMDQIDFTGPFEVLVRVPDTEILVLGTEAGPFKDHKGLVLVPDMTLEQSPALDLLVVPGGPGQQALMEDERLLGFIRAHAEQGKPLFSVCTGALLCGAAGVLRGRHATTHWSVHELLRYFGASAHEERVVIDGNIVSAAGVTAGIDGALQVAALIRGDEVAQAIQLDIQYAPEPPFNAGSPETAPAAVLATVRQRFAALTEERRQTAQAIAARSRVGKDGSLRL